MTFRGNSFSPDAGQSFGTARRDMPTVEIDNTEALRAGAENLLEKALDAIGEGDEERANRYITRACALPYDKREEYHPGPEVANFLAYSFLAELAEIIGTGDVWWVDLTLAYAQTLDDMGQAALTDNLYVLTHEDEYQLPAAAMARVRQAAGEHTSGPYELPLDADSTLGEKIAVTRALLDSFHGLTERVAREVGERDTASER